MGDADEGGLRPAAARLLRSPSGVAIVVALAVRLTIAVAAVLATDGFVIPDERQYVDLATFEAHGVLSDATWQGYGRELYHSTSAFTVPLTWIFEVLWPWRFFAQCWVALLGALTAAATAALALPLIGRRWATIAGLAVAVLPSQVLWSSVVLRESSVWLALAVIALAMQRGLAASRRGPAVAGWAASIAALLVLGRLREQTFLIAAWAVLVTAVAAARRFRFAHAAAGAAVVVLVPLVAGFGVGGVDLIREEVPDLAERRTKLALDAESAFVPTTVVTPTTSATAATSTPVTTAPATTDDVVYVEDSGGEIYAVERSAGTDLRQLPRGLVAVTIRPFPWEDETSPGMRMAMTENALWFILYALAAVGIWVSRRQWREITYPVVVTAAIFAVGAVTQGNLGTAFRHRGQVLWAMALLAAAGARWIGGRRARRQSAAAPPVG